MTAGTETIAADPRFADLEQVQLTVTDGETYTSKKFQILTGVLATGNEDVDAHLNAEWTNGSSGAPAVVTINYAGQTDKKVTLVLFGKAGN